MCYASGVIVIYKNLGWKLKEWWFIIPSLCGLFASLCGNASLLLLFIHWLQLLLLFLGPGSHRQKLRNWCWELVFPVADAQATPGWLTAAAAANNRKWKEICLKMEKERAGGRKGIMCWTARSLHIFYFMILNIILSLHKLLFGSLMGRELFLQAWFPTELVSAAALGSKREESPQSEEPTLPEWVSYGWHMWGNVLQKFWCPV